MALAVSVCVSVCLAGFVCICLSIEILFIVYVYVYSLFYSTHSPLSLTRSLALLSTYVVYSFHISINFPSFLPSFISQSFSRFFLLLPLSLSLSPSSSCTCFCPSLSPSFGPQRSKVSNERQETSKKKIFIIDQLSEPLSGNVDSGGSPPAFTPTPQSTLSPHTTSTSFEGMNDGYIYNIYIYVCICICIHTNIYIYNFKGAFVSKINTFENVYAHNYLKRCNNFISTKSSINLGHEYQELKYHLRASRNRVDVFCQ